ncbi:DUF2797 domain-containing protein, partial [Neptunomonas phycophila]
VADKTNWRAMLKGQVDELDLAVVRDELMAKCAQGIEGLLEQHGVQALQAIDNGEAININYPVIEYPTKVVTHNLDKTPEVEGVLLGIKGQYLILDTGVINMRKYTAYQIELSSE